MTEKVQAVYWQDTEDGAEKWSLHTTISEAWNFRNVIVKLMPHMGTNNYNLD